MISLAVTWVLGLGSFALLFYPLLGSGSEDSNGGAGRHVRPGQEGPVRTEARQRTTVRRRIANVFASFGLSDWSLFVLALGFTVAAIAQSAGLLALR